MTLSFFAFRGCSNTSWVVPYLSRRSTNVTPPWVRIVSIHPHSVAVLFASVSRSSPQVCVRSIVLRVFVRYLRLFTGFSRKPFCFSSETVITRY